MNETSVADDGYRASDSIKRDGRLLLCWLGCAVGCLGLPAFVLCSELVFVDEMRVKQIPAEIGLPILYGLFLTPIYSMLLTRYRLIFKLKLIGLMVSLMLATIVIIAIFILPAES